MTVSARGTARPPRVTVPRGLVVPAYFHPAVAAGDWHRLAAGGRGVSAIVLNSANGPGPAPERELTAAAVATGRPILGYVDTGYGRRPLAAVRADVTRWRDWYPTAGVFLDQVSGDADRLPWYETLLGAVRRNHPGTVVLNHGVHPDPGYADLADALVTFEGPDTAHRRLRVPDWTRDLPADRIWHLVHGVPAPAMAETLERAATANVGTLLVTDRTGANPWDGLPSYFRAQAASWAG